MIGGSDGEGDGSMTDASTGDGVAPVEPVSPGTMPKPVTDGVVVAVAPVAFGTGGVGCTAWLVGLGIGADVVLGVGFGVGLGVAVGGGVASTGALMVTVPAVRVASLLSLATALMTRLGSVAFAGIAVVAAILFWEHRIVKPDDLSRVNVAFFSLNGYISFLLLLTFAADILVK